MGCILIFQNIWVPSPPYCFRILIPNLRVSIITYGGLFLEGCSGCFTTKWHQGCRKPSHLTQVPLSFKQTGSRGPVLGVPEQGIPTHPVSIVSYGEKNPSFLQGKEADSHPHTSNHGPKTSQCKKEPASPTEPTSNQRSVLPFIGSF